MLAEDSDEVLPAAPGQRGSAWPRLHYAEDAREEENEGGRTRRPGVVSHRRINPGHYRSSDQVIVSVQL